MANAVSTLEMANSIQSILSTFDVYASVRKAKKSDSDKNTYQITITGNKQIQRFLDWLYKDSSIFLSRKYQKYQDLKMLNHQKDIKLAG